MGPGRMCLVLGDVTGKGLGAALLMANLQGVLRSQSMVGRGDIGDWLTLANRVCLENWPEGTYATLFLAEYRDETTSLRYINCGHPSPILLRADGSIEQLEATAGVLGLFPDWKCTTEETHMCPGDTLLVYSDGLTEASDADGRELGHERVVDLLRAGQGLPVSKMVKSMVDEVDSFVPEQQDDLTILAARCGRWLN
jgi:serine phosphatase RsbU (regulator of sigma subunit)